MASKLWKKNELEFEDFEPESELQELPEKYTLIVNIPGFKKEHFKVQVDSSGKLSVKGQKQIADNKCKRFNKVFQLPPDSDIEKIRGKFEGEVLTLNVSRREKPLPTNQEVKSSTEEAKASEKKEEESKPKEAKASEKKEEESKSKEEAQASEKKEEESKPKEEANASEKKEEESKSKEEPKQTSDQKEEETKPEEAKTDNKVEEEQKIDDEKIEELTKTNEKTDVPHIKEVAYRIFDTINKWKQNIISGENNENTMKRSDKEKTVSWKERISQETKDLSDYASFDNMLDVINKNRKEIVVAVAAFSIGFIVSRKLSSGK